MTEHPSYPIQLWKESGSTLSYYEWVILQISLEDGSVAFVFVNEETS